MLQREEFVTHLTNLQWRQGEHVFISGPTGTGKSTLAAQLLEKRSHVIGFGVKVHDATLNRDFADWIKLQSFREIEPWMDRVIIWPKLRRKETAAEWQIRQRLEFSYSLDSLLRAQNWGIFIDELGYMSDPKQGGVGNQISTIHQIGRSSGLSVLSLAQRPTWIPQAVIANASHAYIARTRKAEDIKRLSDLSGNFSLKQFAAEMDALEHKQDFIYVPALIQGDMRVINTRM